MKGVPHHLLDVASPKNVFTVQNYTEKAKDAIEEITERNHMPILCGGTGFYIDSLLYQELLPQVPPNKKLRAHYETMRVEKLFIMLLQKDKDRARTIDRRNKVRLVRALEIAEALGEVPKLEKTSHFDVLTFAIAIDEKKHKELIHTRLIERWKKGMVREAKYLHTKGLSYKRMQSLGLEYKYLSLYLQKKISKEEFFLKLEKEIWQYAKRQMTWFKRNKKIHWLSGNPTSIKREAQERVDKFLKK